MIFDIRTADSAYDFVLAFMNMNRYEFFNEYHIECDMDFEALWDRNFEKIDAIDISELQIVGFHVTSSLDSCEEIKKYGLKNLQQVLTDDTTLKRILVENGLWFDVANKEMHYKDQTWDIDYDHYVGRHDLSEEQENLEAIAHRIYYDYCVNGFLACDDVTEYGTNIHKHPEFLMKLADMFKELSELEDRWEMEGTPFEVVFYAYPHQMMDDFFGIQEDDEIPYMTHYELSREQKIKKTLLNLAIAAAYGNAGMQFLYIKDALSVPPEQIISCNALELE